MFPPSAPVGAEPGVGQVLQQRDVGVPRRAGVRQVEDVLAEVVDGDQAMAGHQLGRRADGVLDACAGDEAVHHTAGDGSGLDEVRFDRDGEPGVAHWRTIVP